MKRLVKNTLILLATALVSSSAFATIEFTDDFESGDTLKWSTTVP